MTPRIAATVALVLLALTGCTSNTTAQDTITAQAAQIASLTKENAAIQKRLDTCLATAAEYRGYVEENKVLMQGIIDKWGINYRTPVRDAITALDGAVERFDCS